MGIIGAPRHKLAGLAALLLGFAIGGVGATAVVSMLAWQSAYAFCFRRPLLAALYREFTQES